MIFKKHFISVIVLLFFSVAAQAQDTGFVYRDPSIVSTVDSVDTNTINMGTNESADEEEETEEAFIVDTTLQNNLLAINPDSLNALKNIKGLGYAKNLDSVLLAYQQEQAREEERTTNNPSWIESFFMSPLTKYFFWGIAIIFVVLILSKLFFTEGFFQRSYAKSAVKVVTDDAENLSHKTDYTKLITQAVSSKNYRLAIRYYYLQALQKLTAKGAIDFSPDKTNYEYVQELTGKPYKKEFATLTLHYEYAWYGEFDINQNIFESIEQKFKQFNTVR